MLLPWWYVCFWFFLWLTARLFVRLIDWLIVCSIDRSIHSLIDRSIVWLIDCSFDRSIHSLIDYVDGHRTRNWCLCPALTRKTDSFWWMIFKGGSTQNRWKFLKCFLLLLEIRRPGRLFRQIRSLINQSIDHSVIIFFVIFLYIYYLQFYFWIIM